MFFCLSSKRLAMFYFLIRQMDNFFKIMVLSSQRASSQRVCTPASLIGRTAFYAKFQTLIDI